MLGILKLPIASKLVSSVTINNHVVLCTETASNRATQRETVTWRKIRSQSGSYVL